MKYIQPETHPIHLALKVPENMKIFEFVNSEAPDELIWIYNVYTLLFDIFWMKKFLKFADVIFSSAFFGT